MDCQSKACSKQKADTSCACARNFPRLKNSDWVIGMSVGLMVGIELQRHPVDALLGFATASIIVSFAASYLRKVRGDDIFSRIFEPHLIAANSTLCGMSLKKMMGVLLVLITFLLVSTLSIGIWSAFH